MSGGGDDFIGDPLDIYIRDRAAVGGDVAKAVEVQRFNDGLDLTMGDYYRLVEIRDRIAPGCIIITHSYDFPPASMIGKPAEIYGFTLAGPWAKPSFSHHGWTDQMECAAILKIMLEMFEARMSSFAADQFNYLHVNTQCTVAPERFLNEIHLDEQGCFEVAQVINLKLLPLLDKEALSDSLPAD